MPGRTPHVSGRHVEWGGEAGDEVRDRGTEPGLTRQSSRERGQGLRRHSHPSGDRSRRAGQGWDKPGKLRGGGGTARQLRASQGRQGA